MDDEGNSYPVAFMSNKFDSAECNYEIYDKGLLAIVCSFKCWIVEPRSSNDISILMDH